MTSYIKNNEVGFGEEFDWCQYITLRKAVLECESSSITGNARINRLEKLAVYLDDLTKYVIRFINDRSEVANI